MFRALALLVSLCSVLVACSDETVAAYGGAGKVWLLQDLNGAPFPAQATLRFPQPGQIEGKGPCNAYTATLTAPYPWFEATPQPQSRQMCANQPDEDRFLQALRSMTFSEVSGQVLILSNEAGQDMTFTAGG